MKNKLLLLLMLFFAHSGFTQVKLQDAFPALTFNQPIEIISPDDATNRLFIVSQSGTIQVVANNRGTATAKIFLDITDKILTGGKQGLLGLSFHPDYKNNGFFYLNYTRPVAGAASETVIARYKVSPMNPDQADPASELVLLTYRQPFANHNGGKIAFGPDGYLYIASGDGGGAGDPQNNAQNLTNLLGKILRIDVDSAAPGLNYTVPADNPYVGNTQGFRQEIYAYGLRNPWKFSFDFTTGQLWAGDVGQNSREEISIIVNGGNYGWRVMEGMVCYPPPATCTTTGLILPVFEYTHASGMGKSITGGFVYRGQIPSLQGKYIYGDFVSGNIWALTYNTDGTTANELLLSGAGLVAAFGEDQAKELYICNYSTGKISQLIDPFIAAPTGLAASAASATTITISWTDNAYNETNYLLERAPSADGPYEVLDTLDANAVAFSDTNVTSGTTYFYRIKAVNMITASNSDYTAAVSAAIPKQDQTITFDTLPSRIIDEPPFRLSASASSGLPVTFAIISGPASISDTNLLTITGTGTIVVAASQEGDSSYNSALSVEQRFKAGTLDDLSFITSPADSATDVSLTPELVSKQIPGATQYIVELDTTTDFSGTPLTDTSATNISSFPQLHTNTTYYARVQTDQLPGLWGNITSFKTIDPVTSVDEKVASEFWLKTYPNPTNHFLHLDFNLPVPSLVSVQLFTVLGVNAGTLLPEQYLPQGEQSLLYNISSHSAGVYVYKLKINSEIKTGRIYIIRK